MKKRLTLSVFGVILVCLLLFSGCASSKKQQITGASQEKYLFGTYSAVFSSSLIEMDKAIRTVCRKAKLTEVSKANRANECDYLYKDINGVRLRISIVERKDGSIKIKMKVGATGDKQSCQILLLEIDSQLRSQGALL